MSKLKVSRLKRKHTFGGEFDSKGLVRMLNRIRTGKLARAAWHLAVIRLLEDVVTLARKHETQHFGPIFSAAGKNLPAPLTEEVYRKSAYATFDKYFPGQRRGVNAELEELVDRINRQLCRYRLYPLLGTVNSRLPIKFSWTSASSLVGSLVADIVQLASSGYIERVRKCDECEKWYYARFINQRFCGRHCRQRNYTTSEKGKARRREYMRAYMRKYLEALKGARKDKKGPRRNRSHRGEGG